MQNQRVIQGFVFFFIEECLDLEKILLYLHFNFETRKKEFNMARRCQISGIGPISGNHVSHAHNRRKRRFLPNLQKKRIWVQELNRFITLKVSTKALKGIAKNGTSEVAKLVRSNMI